MNEFDYLAKAKKNMEKEKYHEVISFCDKALKINNDLPEAYSFKGNALYNLGEYNDAAESFSHAIEKEPDEAEHYYDRSWSYCNMDKFEDAIVDMNKALEIEPKTSAFYYDRGRFEYWAERYKDAVVSLTIGIELKPTENKYLFRGNSYMELEEFDLALADFNSSIEINPEFAKAYFRRGILYKKMELIEKAAKDFKKAIELNPKYDDAMIELGYAFIQMGKKDGMKYFNQAIKVNPCGGNYFCRFDARGRILSRKDSIKNFAEGKFVHYNTFESEIFNKKQAKDDINDLSKVISYEADDDTFLLRLRAARYRYLGDYINAINDCSAIIELEPDNEQAYIARAISRYEYGLYKDAVDDCNMFFKLKNCRNLEDALNILFLKIKSEYKLGQYKAVIKDTDKALLFRDGCGLHYYKGLANFKLKHFIRSYKNFIKAIERRSDVEKCYDEKIPAPIKFAISFMEEFNQKKDSDTPIGLCQMKIKE